MDDPSFTMHRPNGFMHTTSAEDAYFQYHFLPLVIGFLNQRHLRPQPQYFVPETKTKFDRQDHEMSSSEGGADIACPSPNLRRDIAVKMIQYHLPTA